MQKTKLGISAALFVAALYFLGLYGGYVITGILVGYVLLREEDSWLKKQAVRVLGLMILFSLVGTAFSLIPNVLQCLYSLLEVFHVDLYNMEIQRFFDFLTIGLNIFRTVAFVILGFSALGRKSVQIPVLDAIVDKFMD